MIQYVIYNFLLVVFGNNISILRLFLDVTTFTKLVRSVRYDSSNYRPHTLLDSCI